MYRSRLGKNLEKVTLDYVSSIDDDVEIAHYDILGSQAHTIMLYENKIIVCTNFVLNFYQTMISRTYYLNN